MQTRNIRVSVSPVKNQEISIMYKGKTYGICSEGQMEYLKQQAHDNIMFESSEKNIVLTEDQIKQKLEEWADNCGFSTLEKILGKMTKEERDLWAVQYRFGAINKSRNKL